MSRTGKYFQFGTLFAIISFGTYFISLLTLRNNQLLPVISDFLSPLINGIVVIVLFLAAKKNARQSRKVAIFWGAIGLSVFFYLLGDISWGIIELVLSEAPFPSVSDLFYLLYYPFFFISIFLIPTVKRTIWQRINSYLDVSIIMIAAILGFWNFLIGPLMNPTESQVLLEQIVLVAYPIGDLVLLGAVLRIIYNKTTQIPKTSIFLLMIGIVVMITADSIYGYQAMLGIYYTGNIIDSLFVLSILSYGLAGIYQIDPIDLKTRKSFVLQKPLLEWIKIVPSMLPYFWLVAAYLLLIQSHLTPMEMGFIPMAIFVGLIIGMVLLRQVITLFENNKLNIHLKNSLEITQVQAQRLIDGNRELQEEIAERKRIGAELSYDALHDRLTGLPNRSLFLDRLNRIIEYNLRGLLYPFSVLFLDLDSFKVINDSLGHNAGDQLLIQVSARLQKILRSSDTVARLGGDEFVILLENDSEEKSPIFVINKILHELSFPYTLDYGEVYISASIGVVRNVIGYEKADDILRDADIAMYRAKQAGKARFELFEESMRNQAISRMELENSLHNALKNQEFKLYYQPIFRVKTKSLIGFEALIRWNHPERGILPPSDFLAVAEDSGIIVSIDKWVINAACLQFKYWQQKYPHIENLTMSVNISSKSLAQSNFVETVENALLESRLSGTSLILEITENVLITNYSNANDIFDKLKRLGIQIQIDDFGSGYSSLSYLQHFPINALKIDRSFITEMSKTKRNQELVSSMIIMTQKMGIDCIAEGIETHDQLEELDQMLCPYGQGFLLSKPVQEEIAESIFANGLTYIRS